MKQSNILVALIGVGNCASSLMQGVTFYRQASADAQVSGLMHADLGGYHAGGMEVTGAFEANRTNEARRLTGAVIA
jgi:myo-inositol-1-phosphate synthase